HAMAYDAGRQTVVLLGGYDGKVLGDLWEWDGKAWKQLPQPAAPPRLHFAMGYDAKRGRLIVFGGFGTSARIGDTWAWAGRSWKSYNVASPPARAEHKGTYIPDKGFVICGGIIGQGMAVAERTRVNDLWLWNGTAWRRVDSSE